MYQDIWDVLMCLILSILLYIVPIFKNIIIFFIVEIVSHDNSYCKCA